MTFDRRTLTRSRSRRRRAAAARGIEGGLLAGRRAGHLEDLPRVGRPPGDVAALRAASRASRSSRPRTSTVAVAEVGCAAKFGVGVNAITLARGARDLHREGARPPPDHYDARRRPAQCAVGGVRPRRRPPRPPKLTSVPSRSTGTSGLAAGRRAWQPPSAPSRSCAPPGRCSAPRRQTSQSPHGRTAERSRRVRQFSRRRPPR